MSNKYIYLIIGQQKFFLENKMKALINHYQKQLKDVICYQSQDIFQGGVLEQEIEATSFIQNDSHKIIIIKQSEILLQAKREEIAYLISYLKTPRPNIFLYFLAEKKKYNTETYTIFQKHCFCETLPFLEKKDFYNYVNNIFEQDGFRIEVQGIQMLLQQTDYDLYFLDQEIKKLKLCQFDQKIITCQLVNQLTIFHKESHVFKLINLFINRHTIEAYQMYQKLKKQKINPFQVIYQMTNKIKDLLLIKEIAPNLRYPETISQILKCSTNKVFFLLKEIKTITNMAHLKNCLLDLIKLEEQVKSGLIHLNTGLELFLLGQNNIFE
ncbi:DNA polymerase III subunit delta ['Fragaria x ananassa' phyllody phytoplasma]|uniref:DNA-directed DNA polymerase n=1 Tax='Fragaria x ananassa' phyllody phytoplasma TaxID=2358428 RepID=A0ABS5K2M4_9MOLU|nr:DNA polymerase III subunit delta ['Fragaria x ananassa' phyllody phytoplasma]MBS2126126.1 DNA polymerase III subunit delta ['Fragaria x ananassa' phyllody phytoplasma]